MIHFLRVILFCPILLGASIQEYPQEALQYPVAFAQVREDPLEEQEIIQKYFPEKQEVAVLMVASGGDTAAYLAGSGQPISRLAIVDPNPAQINLTKLKLRLLEDTKEKRLQILGHAVMSSAARAKELAALMKELNIPEGALGATDKLSEIGPDYAGRYEMVFKALQEHLKPFAAQIEQLFVLNSIDEQRAKIAPNTPLGRAIDEAFDEVMSQKNLVKIFGEKATANRVQEFSRHFAERARVYLSDHLASDSPFVAQVLLGHFYQETRYSWHDLPAQKPKAAIEFSQGMMHQYLQTAPRESFDVIHLSNITDWLSPEEASETLSLAYQTLKPGGVVIIRQLNSDLDLYALGRDYRWDIQTASELNHNDRSFFYRQLLVGIKPSAATAEKMQATQMADEVLKKVPILQGRFFQALRSKQMSLKQFQKTQTQFFFAVDYFSRPMAALVARLPEHAQRVSILENIMEEHGDMNPAKYHSNTFKQFLKSIGTSTIGIKQSPSVLAFNLDLMGASMTEDPYVAIGAFGVIEYAFADISADIGKTVVDRGWVQQENLVHYSLHAQLDKKHAEEFFEIVESQLHDPVKKAQFQKGLELGAYIFNKLYDDLYEEAQTS